MGKNKAIGSVLRRHGVEEDAYAFLQRKGETAGISKSPDPEVTTRGNVQLMKGRTTNRQKVSEGFAKLKHL